MEKKTFYRIFLTFAMAVAMIAAGFGLSVASESPGGKSDAGKQGNNNDIIALQNKGGDPGQEGDVKLEYFGHCAIRVTTPKGLSVLIDPWKNDPSGTWGVWYTREFPMTTADIAMSTHPHYDHNALGRVKANMVLDRMAGQYVLGDLKITGIADKHQYEAPGPVNWTGLFPERGINRFPPDNPPILDNTVMVLDTGGLRIAHLGDMRPDAPDAVFDAIGRPDVLILAIDDSEHIYSFEQADELVKRLNPRIVIPGHYKVEGMTSVASTLRSADKWVKSNSSVKRISKPMVTINPAEVKKLNKTIYYFGDNVIGK